MAASDASPFPIKNQAYRVTFPILDADGDLVTGATGLDSEISKDGGTFVDCTNEATEIATSSGMYFLDLSSTEMNADTVAIIIKTTSSGAKTTPVVLYPVTLAEAMLGVQTVQFSAGAVDAAAIATGAIDADAIADNAIDAGALATGAITAAKFAAGAIDAAAIATDAITAAKIAADAIGASELAVDAVNEIADQVWDEALAGHLGAGSTGAALNAAGSAGDPWATALPGAYGAGTAGKIVGDNINATVSSRATQASVDLIDDFVDDLESRLGVPSNLGSGATIAANLVDIEGQTDDIGVAGAGLTAIPWNAAWDAEVQSEVDDALNTAIAELSQGIPTATPTLRTGLMLLYMVQRNLLQITATEKRVTNDAGTVITKKALSDDGTTYAEAEMVSGP